MLSLLGILPQLTNAPFLHFDYSSELHYTARTGALDVSALPVWSMSDFSDASTYVEYTPGTQSDFQLHIKTDRLGNLAGGITSSDSLALGHNNPTGADLYITNDAGDVLLTGEIKAFGFSDPAVSVNSEEYDFRFQPTGGAWLSAFNGQDIGVDLVSIPNLGYAGNSDFTVDFDGTAQGYLAPIPAVGGPPPQQPGSLSGQVYVDKNANGVFDGGDTAIDGATVTLTGTDSNGNAIAPLVTQTANVGGVDGVYNFTNLNPGTYTVTITPPGSPYVDGAVNPGSLGGTAGTETISNIAVGSGQNGTAYNFAELQPGSLAGKVYVDKNANGSFDAGDAGLNGVIVTLTGGTSANPIVRTTQTANVNGVDGVYSFGNLPTGTYAITITPPGAGYVDGAIAAGSLGGTVGTQTIASITVGSGQNGTAYNFAELPLATISGHKYVDVTGNGLSADDTPYAGGVTINLYKDLNNNGILDASERTIVATTTTATTGDIGSYHFNNLAPGTYFTEEVVPTGWLRTGPTLLSYNSAKVTYGTVDTTEDFADFQTNACSCALTNIYYLVTHNGCTTKVTSLGSNVHQGDTVQAFFTVKTGSAPQTVSLASYIAPENVFVSQHAYAQNLFASQTGTYGPGSYSLKVTVPASYYQVDFVCGAPISRLGPTGSNIFYTPQGRLIASSNGGTNAANFGSASLEGTVYLDANRDKVFNTGDTGLEGQAITLTGTDVNGHSVYLVTYTDSSGNYYFTGLAAGTYQLANTPEAGYVDEALDMGTIKCSVSAYTFTNIVLKAGQNAYNYDFAELLA